MTVKRIVANITAINPAIAKPFYEEILGLECVMDYGWITTLAGNTSAVPQISIASEGGSGTPVPEISIEVDNIDSVYQQMQAARFEIVYDIVDEPWGVRRFFVRDPLGKLINILSHIETEAN